MARSDSAPEPDAVSAAEPADVPAAEPQTRRAHFAAVWAAYGNWRTALMLVLGFSAGLPFLLVFGTLSAWLTEAGVSRTEIGLLSYVGLAYTLKFVWAPVMDRLNLPGLTRFFGRRRAWMLIAQLGIMCGLMGIATSDPSETVLITAAFALLTAFSSATQDIAIDAWRIEAASDERQGAMAAAYQLGYRFALIGSGAGALYLAEYVSWFAAYAAMAGLMGLGMLGALLAPRVGDASEAEDASYAEEEGSDASALVRAGHWLRRAIVSPFVDFFARYRWEALLILAMIGAYRVPDFVMGVMANPFYLDLGFSKADIANIVKLYGIWLSIAGAFAGGAVVAWAGLLPTLVVAGIAAAVTNLIYAWLSTQGANLGALTLAISAENFAGGFAATALIAYMSSLTSTAFTATQYALFSSFYALPGKILGGLSGVMVDGWGYFAFFSVTAALGIPAVLLASFMWWRTATGRSLAHGREATRGRAAKSPPPAKSASAKAGT